MKPPTRISLRLLGRLALAYGDDPTPIRLSTRKAGALIAYLAMNPEQTASREKLATLLWGSCTDQQARQSLRQALALLRKELRWSHFLSADTEMIRLQPGMWSVDARDFEGWSKSSDPKDLERAARLFGGEFLIGLNIAEDGFEEWVRALRQRMQLAAARLCETFATRPDLVADGEQAVAVAEQLLALDPLREDWQRLALTLYARYRGKNEALAQAEAFAKTLERELGVPPEGDTQNLVERIRGGEIALAVNAPAGVEPPAVTLPTIAAYVPQDEKTDDVSQPPSVQPHPARWSARTIAVSLALAALVVASGIVGLTYYRPAVDLPAAPKAPTLVSSPAAVGWQSPLLSKADTGANNNKDSNASDPWRSPRLPAQPAADASAGQGSGLVAMAVLPFTSLGEGSERSNLLADLITDDLTSTLSRVGRFRIISRQTAMSYRGQRVDPGAVGGELGVRYLLEGNVSAHGNQLGVNVELIDTKSRQRVWTGRYDREGADRHAISDEIVNGLGRELSVEVTRAEGGRASANPDVHELIFKGWSAILDAAASGLPALTQAETYFTRALEREPQNMSALTGLAGYHILMAVQLFAPDPAPHLARADSLLQPILDHKQATSDTYAYMGLLQIARKRSKEAAQWFERAIELNPSQANAYAQLGRLLVAQRRPAEGFEHILYAMRLSPRDPGMSYWLGFAGAAQLELGNDTQAIDFLNRAIALHPTQPRTLLVLVAAHAMAGNLVEARAKLAQLQKVLPHLTGEKLIERSFGATASRLPRLSEGLRLALAVQADAWQSPPMPPEHRGANADKLAKLITAIAVLPFTTYGETAGSIQVTADMVTDDLINALSRVANLRVVSRQTSFSYRGQAVDVAAIGAELGVRYVLEGSMRMHGDKLRVNVELIDPATRLPVWTTRIERDRAERHTVQDEIVGRLARELQFEIYQVESKRAPQDPDMAELNSIGWAAIFDHGTQGVDALRRAEAAFKGMQARDPHNWSAAAGLGAYHVLIGSLQLVPDWKTHLTKGEELVRQSLREQPNAANQHFYLAIIQRMRGEVQDAMESLGRCLDIAPSMAPCHAHLGHSLVWLKRPGEGLEHIRYALRLSPRDATRSHWLRFAGEAELELDHYDQAVSYLRQSAALNARQPMTLRSLAAALALAGQLDEARQRMTEVKTAAPHISDDGLLNRSKRIESTQPQLSRGLRLVLTPPS